MRRPASSSRQTPTRSARRMWRSSPKTDCRNRSGPLFSLAPDLAVEVVSPSDVAQDVRRKVIDYLQAGTRLVWVVYPDTRTVDVYRPGQDVRVVEAQSALHGEDLLPDFELPLRELFDVLEE